MKLTVSLVVDGLANDTDLSPEGTTAAAVNAVGQAAAAAAETAWAERFAAGDVSIDITTDTTIALSAPSES